METCGLRCGKHGCCGPHSSPPIMSPGWTSGSPMMDELDDDMAEPMPSGMDTVELRLAIMWWLLLPSSSTAGPRSRSLE